MRLTSRERQLVKLVWAGKRNREIAATLGIAKRTVEVHRLNIHRKLKVHNTAQMLRAMLKAGVVRL